MATISENRPKTIRPKTSKSSEEPDKEPKKESKNPENDENASPPSEELPKTKGRPKTSKNESKNEESKDGNVSDGNSLKLPKSNQNSPAGSRPGSSNKVSGIVVVVMGIGG